MTDQPRKPVTALVCVGDSFTEGMCDDLRPDGHHLGWADRVAGALARAAATGPTPHALEYANLAVRGKVLDQVVREQVPVALGLHPDLLTFHAGANDVLRPGSDLPGLAMRYRRAVLRLVDAAGTVVLFTAISRAGVPNRLGSRLAARFAVFNDNVRAVARDDRVVLVDLDLVPAMSDRRLWAPDRLHLNAAGHTRVASAVLERLGVTDPDLLGGPPGWWREPLPEAAPGRRREEFAADLQWARHHLLPWVGRRLRGVSSGDDRDPKDAVPVRLLPR